MKFDELGENGWCELQSEGTSTLHDELLRIGRKLGNPVAPRKSVGLIHELQPVSTARFRNSLSAKYATGEFPLHTDTAHWPTPCRYIVLGCAHEGARKRKTNLVDFRRLLISDEERFMLMSEPFKIRNGRHSFYGTILSKNRPFLRYDPGCMTPARAGGVNAESVFCAARAKECNISIAWFEGKIVVVDNWRFLHGREAGAGEGRERVLYRMLIA